jgi:hypothetical protein
MLKKFAVMFILILGNQAMADDCVDQNGNDILNQPDVFQALIEKSTSCSAAVQLAEACAWGSSMDVSTAGIAYGVCEKEFNAQKPTKALQKLLGTMKQACTAKYDKKAGTMYRSFNSYCHLSALEWVLNIATDN